MFLVKVEFIKDSLTTLTLIGKCDYLPVTDHDFSIRVFSGITKTEKIIDFGKVLEQREDFGVTTFRTSEGVYELFVLEILPFKKKVNPPNVYDFASFKAYKQVKKPVKYSLQTKRNKLNNLYTTLGVTKNKTKVISLFDDKK